MERTETEFLEAEASMNENSIQIKKEEEYSEFLALFSSSCEQQYVPPTCIYIKEEDIVTEELVVKDPEDEEVDVENIDDLLPDGNLKTVEEFPHNMMEPLVQVETQDCKQEWDAEEVVESNDTGGTASCPECGLRLPAGASLSRHVLSHQLQRRLTCALCGQLCSSSVMLMRHLHSAHAVDMPPAGVPAASTSTEDTVGAPKRTKRPYVRRTLQAAPARMRSPGEGRELRCSQCGKAFHSRLRLESHERLHSEGGLHPCMYCPKCFTREGALKTHLLKHNGSSLGSDSKTKHFQQMNFLHKEDTARSFTGNVRSFTGNVLNTQKSDTTEIIVNKIGIKVESRNAETPVEEDSFTEKDDERTHTWTPFESIMAQELQKLKKKRHKKKTRPVYDVIKLNKTKVTHIEASSSKNQKSGEFDGDYFFLMSLLPHLRVIPQHLKLIVRGKLKQVLLENLPTYWQFQHTLPGSPSPHQVHQGQNT